MTRENSKRNLSGVRPSDPAHAGEKAHPLHEQGQPIATTAVQDVLQCQVHAEVVRRVDVLAHSFKYSLSFKWSMYS